MINAKRPSAIDVEVGVRLRLRRRLLNISQSDLASVLGITFQQVQKYEKGVNRISASRLQQIAVMLNVPISFFFDDKRNLISTAIVSSGVQTSLHAPEVIALNRWFLQIKDKTQRRHLIALVIAIAKDAEPAHADNTD